MRNSQKKFFKENITLNNDRNKIGIKGESAACEYLMKKGCVVIDRNFRVSCGEIDIVALDDKYLVFIEVKTRKNADFGYPSEFVNKEKQMKLRRAAQCYYSGDGPIRFDVIEVFYKMDGDRFVVTELNHIEDAF